MNPNYPPDCQSPDDAGTTTCACGRTIAIDTADERDGRLVCIECFLSGNETETSGKRKQNDTERE